LVAPQIDHLANMMKCPVSSRRNMRPCANFVITASEEGLSNLLLQMSKVGHWPGLDTGMKAWQFVSHRSVLRSILMYI
jgi:hypothetical protein